MSYTSLNFMIFVAVFALAYFLFPLKKSKWVVLLIASYAFYLYAGYKYVSFILLTTCTTYFIARWIDKISLKAKDALKANKEKWDKDQKKDFKRKTRNKKRCVLALALVLNFGILAFLKYFNFLSGGINDLISLFKIDFSVPTLKLFLPLGISFYTFQSMGYIVDVYREKFPAETNIAKLALFVSFFPQIIQGPISFYSQLAHQLYEPHQFNFTRFKHGCELILWGFFKKLVIADRAVIAINAVTDKYSEYNGTTLLFVILLYALQLYADFSGGIDISRGVAQIFGIDLAENFRRPYFSKDINEYWRRWHISLGAWMKEYVFYPIAMSEVFLKMSKRIKGAKFGKTSAGVHVAKVLPTSIASLIVFFLVGIWHGANLKYVAFGIWNGGIIMVSILLKPIFDLWTTKLKINSESFLFGVFQMLRTFIVVLVGYVFDVAPDFSSSMRTFKLFFTDQNISLGISQISRLGLLKIDYVLLLICTVFLFLVSVFQERHKDMSLRVYLDTKPFIVRYIMLLFGIIALLVFGIYGPGYDPAEFVYMQF